MEIKYLTKLAKYNSKGSSNIQGISELEIQQFEKQLNIQFPVSYIEFLYLAGKDSGDLSLFPGTSHIKKLADENFRKFLNELLEKHKPDLNRPFWPFTEYDDFQHFLCFYLDDASHDPDTYQVEMTDVTVIKPLNLTFSQYINGLVDK